MQARYRLIGVMPCAMAFMFSNWILTRVRVASMKPFISFVASVALASGLAHAECVAGLSVYMQLKVLACSSSYQHSVSNVDMRKYSQAQMSELKTSAGYVTVVDAETLSYVDIIDVNSKSGGDRFRGDTHPIAKNTRKKFMLTGTTVESCEKYYQGQTSLFAVDEHFACCRDVITPDAVETSAQCLTRLPLASMAGSQLESLRYAKIKVLGKP